MVSFLEPRDVDFRQADSHTPGLCVLDDDVVTIRVDAFDHVVVVSLVVPNADHEQGHASMQQMRGNGLSRILIIVGQHVSPPYIFPRYGWYGDPLPVSLIHTLVVRAEGEAVILPNTGHKRVDCARIERHIYLLS
jgi:hypothetical protein